MLDNIKRREKAVLAMLVTLIAGWFVYFFLFLMTSHFSRTLNLDFLSHDTSEVPGIQDWFRDFFQVNRAAAEGKPYIRGDCSNYPPLALALAKVLAVFTPNILTDVFIFDTILSRDGLLTFGIFFTGMTLLGFSLMYRFYRKNLTNRRWGAFLLAGTTMLSYSYLFCVERGNYLIVAYIAFLVFAFTYEEHEVLSAVALAVCACIKVYPVFFILLYLLDKRYKGFFVCAVIGLRGLLLPLILFEGTPLYQLSVFLETVVAFGSSPQAGIGESFAYVEQHSNSLVNIFRTVALYIANSSISADVQTTVIRAMQNISVVCKLVVAVSAVYSLVRSKQLWKKMCVLLCLILLLPNNTYDYMLVFFLPLLAMAICNWEEENTFYIVAMTLLACVPKTYYFYTVGAEDVSIQCVLNPLIMVVMLGKLFLDCCVMRRTMEALEV